MEIELFDGAVLEFPDGTAPEVIDRVAKRETVQRRVKAAMQAPRKAEYSPLDGMSAVQRFVAGAGKATMDIGRGVRQIAQDAGNAMGLVSDETVARNQATIDESRQLDAPLMSDTAGVLGNVAGNIAVTTLPLGIAARGAQAANLGRTAGALRAITAPTTYGSAAASGALMGAIQPTATDESRGFNAAVGGVTGVAANALGNAIGRVAQPVKKALGAADKRAVTTLEQAGVPLDAAQKSGSPILNRIKSTLKDNPVTAGAEAAKIEEQRAAFTRAVLQKIGVNANAADQATMGAIKTAAGQNFDNAINGVSFRLSNNFKNRLQVLAASSKRQLPGTTNQITQTIDDILARPDIDGAFYQNLRSDLSALEMQPQVSPLARDLREAIDNAFEQAAGGQRTSMIRDARRMWRNMRIIEKAIDTEGGGQISPAKLANAFGTKANRNAGVYGKGDRTVVELARLAQAGKRLLIDKLPNSGTTARAMMQVAAPAVIGGVYGGIKEGDLSGIGTYALAGAALPLAAQRVINTPAVANYLANGMRAGASRNALAAAGSSPLLRRLPVSALPALNAE